MKAVHPECSIVLHLQEKEAECQLEITLAQSLFNYSATNTGELSQALILEMTFHPDVIAHL